MALWEHNLCATSRRSGYTSALRSRTRCAPTREHAGLLTADHGCRPAICGSAPCARQTYGAVHPGGTVAHRVRSHRQAGVAKERRDAPSRCAARPGFKSSAIRARCAALGGTSVYPRRLSPDGVPRAFGLIPAQCCGRYQAILFGLLFSWASKRKVTRAAAADRNARRVGGQIAVTRQPSAQSLDSCFRRNDEQKSGRRRDNELGRPARGRRAKTLTPPSTTSPHPPQNKSGWHPLPPA